MPKKLGRPRPGDQSVGAGFKNISCRFPSALRAELDEKADGQPSAFVRDALEDLLSAPNPLDLVQEEFADSADVYTSIRLPVKLLGRVDKLAASLNLGRGRSRVVRTAVGYRLMMMDRARLRRAAD